MERRTQIEVTEHERGGWIRAERPADRRLRGFLARDPVGFADHGTAPLSWVDMPSTSVSLILACGDPYPGLPGAFAAGLAETWSTVDLGACGSSIDLKLTPLGAYRLLGVPMDELAGRTVDLRELLGPAVDRLLCELAETDDWGVRLDLAEGLLAARAGEGVPVSAEVAWSWRRLIESRGAVRISELAGEVGWSHRHLISRFRRQVGLAPKTAARVIRFRAMLAGLGAGRDGLAELAYEHGYSDQAHLNRDFREFTGTTPTGYLKRVNFVQDGGGGPV